MDRWAAVRRRTATLTASGILRVAGTPYGDGAARYLNTLNRLFHNDSGNIKRNGEAWLLSQLGGTASVVFDVGANRGGWTSEALRLLPTATIHSFEPIHDTFVELARVVGAIDRVHLNELALTDRPAGQLQMWADECDGQMSSATAPPSAGSRELVVACTTGDEYVGSHRIDHIDLLKVDVEGHEMEVLRGFSRSLSSGVVDLVQFEFTLWAAIARRWLADYYELFSEQDFQVGKLWPRGVRWRDYSPTDEEFYRCNFVAARRGSKAARLLGGV